MTLPALCWMLSPPDGRAGAGQRVLHVAHAVSNAGIGVRLIRPDREDLNKSLHTRCSELAQRWQAERPRWVYVEVPEPASEPWRLVAQQLGIPLLTTWHPIGWMAPLVQQPDLQQYLEVFLRSCHHILAETPAIRKNLAATGLLDVTVVNNGVDTQRFHPRLRSHTVRQRWGAEPETLVALHVGRLEPEKNLTLLARAFLAIRATVPTAILVCVGAGTGSSQLATAVPGLVLPGFLEGAALAEAYAAGDLFLFPSIDDPYGNVVLEAAASGLAVIAFERAAAALCLAGAAAMVPVANEPAFLAAACQLATDQSARIDLASRARMAAERCSWHHTAVAFVNALARAEQSPPRSRLPGVTPVTATVTAPLPADLDTEPYATFRLLVARGHQLDWQDDEGGTVAGALGTVSVAALTHALPPPDARGAWSRRTECAEARLMAWAAGNPPQTQPLRIAAVYSAPQAPDTTSVRFCELVAGLRQLGHPVQVQALSATTTLPVPPADPRQQQRQREHITAHLIQRWRDDRPDGIHIELLDFFGICAGHAAIILRIPWTFTWHPEACRELGTGTALMIYNLIELVAKEKNENLKKSVHTHAIQLSTDETPKSLWDCKMAIIVHACQLTENEFAKQLAIIKECTKALGARLLVTRLNSDPSTELASVQDALVMPIESHAELPAIYVSALESCRMS